MYTVEGKKYLYKTANKVCQICTAEADGRMMWAKQELPDDMVVLECPYCEVYGTVLKATVLVDKRYK